MPREPMDRPTREHDGPDRERSTDREPHEREHENESEGTNRELGQSASRERWLGGEEYDKEFKRMADDVNDWMRENGYEKASGLRSEDRSVFGTQQNDSPFSLTDRSTGHSRSRELRLMDPWVDMSFSAMERGFVVTGSNEKKGHNRGSAHYNGRAIDVRTRGKTNAEIESLMRDAKLSGYKVKDERVHPPGQKVWSGPHIHIEAPARNKESRTPRTSEPASRRDRSGNTRGDRLNSPADNRTPDIIRKILP